jgi:cytochrome b6-f complex iron-sulfur subunit
VAEKTGKDLVNELPSRRSTLYWLALTLGSAAFAETVWVASSFLRPRKRRSTEQGGTLVVAGPVDNFEANSVTAFQKGKFYLVRLEDGGFLALHRRCTHLGCTVPWDEEAGRFACPCHASSFDIRGEVLSPPAPRALDLFAVRIENDIVKVETSRPIQRKRFDPTQVARV